jgi:3D (Asp-Asp-Asp) domain-containing protein
VKRTPTLILICAVIIKLNGNSQLLHSGEVLGASTQAEHVATSYNTHQVKIETKTAFEQKELTETEEVPFETKYEKDPDSEYGTEKTKQEGKDGKIIRKYLLTYWQEETIDKQLINTQKTEPTVKIILKGSKIVWRLLEGTENGRLKYWYKMRVWATKYDANCYGCTGRTYSGTEVKKGVCATDPKVIPLGTNFYVEGYGLCRAEDIGGAIKGNKLDLGFVDASKGNWGSAYTNVYLLTNAPE